MRVSHDQIYTENVLISKTTISNNTELIQHVNNEV